MGYVLSDPNPTRVEQTKSFRTKLAGNINKYITSRYCPNKDLTGYWDANPTNAALINPVLGNCDDIQAHPNRNKSGYFYYQGNG